MAVALIVAAGSGERLGAGTPKAFVEVAGGPADLVLVHDAARPLLSPALAEDVIAALEGDPIADAAIAAAPVSDTIKRAGPDGGAVAETLDRRELWSVQTPQVFRRGAL